MASQSPPAETPCSLNMDVSVTDIQVDIERGSSSYTPSDLQAQQCAEDTNENKVGTSLAQFYRKRWRVTVVVSMFAFLQSVLLGSSSLIDALSAQFSGNNGVYATVLALPVANTLAGQLIRLFNTHPHLQVPVCASGVLLVPMGFFCTYIAVTISNTIAGTVLLYVGMTVLLGLGLGVLELVNMYWGLLWWSVDGKQSIGVGILGGALGVGAIFWTLVAGWFVSGLSLEACLVIEAALTLALALAIASAVCIGYCGSPPSEEDVRTWMIEAGAIKEDVSRTTEGEDGDTSATAAGGRPAGTSVLVPVVCTSTWELFSYPVTSMLLVSGAGLAFVGYATKTLLSIMFTDMFGVGEQNAAYLAAASLVLFALGRFAVPYFLMDNPRFGTSALGISIAAQAITGIVYAVLPFITGDASSSWNLIGFVIAKSVSGFSFAVGAVVGGALGVQLFGTANMHLIMVPGWFLYGIGGALGPIVAYTSAADRVENGMGYAQAYSLYFYIAAGAAAINVALMVIMYAMERKASLLESQKLASKA